MKSFDVSRFVFSIAAVAFLGNATAQAQCSDLFISEYIEGWGNNKCVEIYNPTDAPVDLSDYQIERYSNGSPSAAENQKVQLTGMLGANDVVVCVLDKQNPDGIEFEQPVWDELAEAADLWLCPVYDVNNAMYFNGNDALVLSRISDNTNVDIFGIVGQDPGETGWEGMTQNHTLVRKPEVTAGHTDVFSFDVAGEWNGTPWQSDSLSSTLDSVFVNLGSHLCDCGTSGLDEKNELQATNIYPNPVDNGTVVLQSDRGIVSVELINLAGQLVASEINFGSRILMTLEIGAPQPGIYMVRTMHSDGQTSTGRLVVQH